VGGDGAVRGWVGDAGEDESVTHLVVIQEGLVRLVNGSSLNLSSAGRASSGTARVWEIDSYTKLNPDELHPVFTHDRRHRGPTSPDGGGRSQPLV
jgi:hypothetical protein